MAITHSPNISAQGLIAAYDSLNDKKSWLGDTANLNYPSSAFYAAANRRGFSIDPFFSAICSASTKIADIKGTLNYRTRITSTGINTATVTSAEYFEAGIENLSRVVNINYDDDFITHYLPWSVNYLGTMYTQVFNVSNLYLTFGQGSSTFSGLSPSEPSIPKIFLAGGDNSYQRVYAGIEGVAPNRTYRIVQESAYDTSGAAGSPDVVFEWIFYENKPNQIDLQVNKNLSYYNSYENSGSFLPSTQNYSFAADVSGPAPVVDSSLKLWLDAGKTNSYSGTGSTWYDISGTGNNGAIQSGVTYNSLGYFDFNGTTGYVSLANQPTGFAYGAAPGTICAWAKTNSINGGFTSIFAYGTPSLGQSRFIIINNADWIAGGFGLSSFDIITGGVPLNTWAHVAEVYDGTTAYLYINGVLAASAAKTWNTTVGIASVGRQTNGVERWNGSIAQVQVYNRALSINEIKQNFNAGYARYATRYTWGSNANQYAWQYFGEFTTRPYTSYTGSVYVKGQTSSIIFIEIANDLVTGSANGHTRLRAKYNTATNSVEFVDSTPDVYNLSSSVTAASQGWYRVTVTGTFTTAKAVALGISNETVSTGDILLLGAQVEIGPKATALVTTTTAASTAVGSGRLLDITNNNNITYSTNTHPSEFNNTNNSFIKLTPKISAAGPTSTTFDFWFRLDKFVAGTNQHCLFTSGAYLTNGFRILLAAAFGRATDIVGQLNVSTVEAGGTLTVQSPYLSIKLNTNYHIGITYDSATTTGKIYINGVEVASATGTYIPATDGVIQVGGGNFGTRSIDGIIDSFKQYNRALSASEIKQNYAAQRNRYPLNYKFPLEGIMLHLDANNVNSYTGTGTTWSDISTSGTGGNASLVGSPEYSLSFANGNYNTYGAQNGWFEATPANLKTGFFNLNGTSQYVTVNTNFLSCNKFTVSLWVMNTARGTGDGQILCIGNEKLLFYTNIQNVSSPQYAFSVFSPTIFNNIPRYSTTVMELNTWYNLVGVYTGTSFEMFVNGQSILYTTTSISSVTLTTETVQIGRRINTSLTNFPGNVSNLQLYNRDLSIDEIKQNYDTTKGRHGL